MAALEGCLSALTVNDKSVVTTVNTLDKPDLKMGAAGSFYIPKDRIGRPDSKGEDAHFICSGKQTIGVADGVGAWASRGIDAGEYARQLMKNCIDEIQQPKEEAVVPKLVLKKAYDNTDHEGSSTACLITLKENFLNAVNVGDSGFVVIRRRRVVYRSPVQQHLFNCPYNLGKGVKEDRPESGMELKVAVEPGDIVVAGTDGLFDNVYATEIRKLVVEAEKNLVMAEDLARSIAEFALSKSRDKAFLSPFAKAARDAGFAVTGGKCDDITVIVAYIVPSI